MAGTAGIQNGLYVLFTQSAAAAANHDYTLTRGGLVADAWCYARASSLGAGLQISRNRSSTVVAITDAMNVAIDQVITHAGTIDDTVNSVAAADAIRFQTLTAGTFADAVVVLIPNVAAPQTVV